MSNSATRQFSSRLRLSALRYLLACAILTLPVHLTSAQNNPVDLRGDGGAIIFQDGVVTVRSGAMTLPPLEPIPPDEELLKIEVSEELLAVVSRLDHAEYEQRERAMQVLLRFPAENTLFYALLAQSRDETLSPEQHHRVMAALRERIVNRPGGALGISMRHWQNVQDQRFDIEVTALLPDLPAAEALRVGDRIVALDGEPFQATHDLTARVQWRQPGDTVTLTVVRSRRGEEGRPVLDEQHGIVMEVVEIAIELGSTDLLRDPETGLPQVFPAVVEQRHQQWREAERRFRREPVRIELDGELPGAAPAARGAQRGRGAFRRAAPPERPQLAEPLFAAILGDNEPLALQLVERGAPVNARNERGVTVLHYAARATMPVVTRRLLEYGADIDAAIEGNVQPIHWAARTGVSHRPGAAETVDVLLEFGVDINARTHANVLPITYAIQLGNDEWRDFLISRGAVVE